MNIQLLDINQIKPYGRNPRRNEHAVEVVADSIRLYGFQQPIVVDKNMEIVVGHTRYKAAKKLSMQQVPVVVADQLTEQQAQAYRLADNKIHEYSEWDDNLLVTELEELLAENDLKQVSYLTAFSELEIEKLLKDELYATDEQVEQKTRDTKPYQHRVAVLILKNSYVNRGVANSTNGWIEWGLRNDVIVDLISDSDEIRNNQFRRYEETTNWHSQSKMLDTELAPTVETEDAIEPVHHNANVIASTEHLRDDYAAMRYPILRLDDASKLRSGLIHALSLYAYDAIIINTVDILLTVLSIGLHNEFKNLYYVTRSEDDIGVGKRGYFTPLTHALLKGSGIKVICQTQRTYDEFIKRSNYDKDKVFIASNHLGQPELQEFQEPQDKKGVLYIGPWEDRKDPEVFINACKLTGLPALVIASSKKSAEKFKKRLLEEGIEHEIHYSLTGMNKVNVLRRGAVAVIPSREETFCNTAYECAHVCPTIIPEEREWTQAHDAWCYRTPIKDIPQKVKELYGKPVEQRVKDALMQNVAVTDAQCLKFLHQERTEFSVNNALSKWLDTVGEGTLEEFFKTRPSIVIDELYFVPKLMAHKDYEFTHTKEATWVRKLTGNNNDGA